MTGTDHHITGLGQLSEFVRNSPAHQGKPGHEGYLNDRVVALPELLRDGGYHTIMSGKWHLGLKPEYSPKARGFNKSFALLPGCANHYGYEPPYESIDEPPRLFETAVTALHMEKTEYVDQLHEDFYSPDFYATKMLQYLEERSLEEKQKPFFAYLPFSAPHWPLQAPKESMDKYRGLYADGPETLRLRRLERLKELGLVDHNVVPHEIVTAPGELGEWNTMTDDERAKSARSMEAYAGMVDRMDENIGRVLHYLRATGEFDNTYVFFMSDNGAEGASYEARDVIRKDVLGHIAKYYNNELDNIGRHDSFVWYGNRWAQAATAPSRLYKMFSTQGGYCFALRITTSWLGEERSSDRRVLHRHGHRANPARVLRTRTPSSIQGPASGTAPWQDLKAFLDASAAVKRDSPFDIHGENHVTGFEVAGSGALRRGRFKITYVPKPHGPQRWELFDILNDPGETDDIGKSYPEVLEKLLALWVQYREEVGVVGLRGEYGNGADNAVKDEFEDTGKWMRFIGKKDVPETVRKQMKV
ncbi:hypothetical protein LTR37_014960 [Vermiconidia calcicola]|uniref:Uncharacterized protein n=1 Tax=Vermiconidia calcicola TaxID=1690605 RepID=A0ACC3MS75_9PEZI|nr:hypothetical protein LTR37_014960 [Vermiconidia calcicola]